MRIAIIGSGALGCLFGGSLASDGHRVNLLHRRQEYTDYVNENGLRIQSNFRPELEAASPLNIPAKTDASEVGRVDLALVLVKAHHTRQALNDHQACLGPDTRVLSLQNGLRNYTHLREVVGPERALAGVTYQGGVLTAPGVVEHTADGESILGGANHEARSAVGEALSNAGFETTIVDDPQPHIWDKQLLSLAIKPLAALTRLPNNSLVASDDLVSVMKTVVDEAMLVAESRGITLPRKNVVEQVVETIEQGSDGSGSHKSSMLQDIEASQKTEIDEINGAVVELAEQEGVSVPYNRLLTTLVRGLEQSYLGNS